MADFRSLGAHQGVSEFLTNALTRTVTLLVTSDAMIAQRIGIARRLLAGIRSQLSTRRP